MLKYILRKLLALIPKLLVISIVVFFALDLLPGDALSRTILPDQYHELSENQKTELREAMGLNDPAPVRYAAWRFWLLSRETSASSEDIRLDKSARFIDTLHSVK